MKHTLQLIPAVLLAVCSMELGAVAEKHDQVEQMRYFLDSGTPDGLSQCTIHEADHPLSRRHPVGPTPSSPRATAAAKRRTTSEACAWSGSNTSANPPRVPCRSRKDSHIA